LQIDVLKKKTSRSSDVGTSRSNTQKEVVTLRSAVVHDADGNNQTSPVSSRLHGSQVVDLLSIWLAGSTWMFT